MSFDPRAYLKKQWHETQDERFKNALVELDTSKPVSRAAKTLELATTAVNPASSKSGRVLEPSSGFEDPLQTRTVHKARKTYAARKVLTLEQLKLKFDTLEFQIRPNSLEHKHQKLLLLWCDIQALENPDLECLAWIHAIPNAGLRTRASGGMMVAEGLKSGVPDLFLDEPRGVFHGLRIEMKRQGGRVSDTQELWLKHLMERGYFAVVCVGWLEARDTILWYLETK